MKACRETPNLVSSGQKEKKCDTLYLRTSERFILRMGSDSVLNERVVLLHELARSHTP